MNSSPPNRAIVAGNVNGLEQQLDKSFDEPVAGVVAEVVVDHLEPVKVEEQRRDRTGLAVSQSFVEMGDQRPAVQQVGQVVVLGEVEHPLLGDNARLQLCEERRNRLECVDLLRQPFAVTDLDEAQNAGGYIPGEQRHTGDRAVGNTCASFDIALILGVCRTGTQNKGLFLILGQSEDGVRVRKIDHPNRVRFGNEDACRPQRDEHCRMNGVIVVTQKAEIHAEVGDQVFNHLLADRGMVGRGGRHQLGSRRSHQVV